MHRLVLFAGLGLCSCATTVSERYQLGHPDRLPGASLEAAARLGWTTQMLEGGKFRLAKSRLPQRDAIDVSPGPDGVLTLTGQSAARDWDNRPTLGPSGPLLAQATLQVMGVPKEGPPLSRRSPGLTVGLDLLFPAAGAAYALPGSPYSFWHWGGHVGLRAGMDALAAVFIAQGMEFRRAGYGDGTHQLGLAIGYLVFNRLMALLVDLPTVSAGNTAADNGLWLDLSRAPVRLPDLGR
ncbi:MAG: hypothetical protein ACYC8T_18735 [Myxococcaceae bacterium]